MLCKWWNCLLKKELVLSKDCPSNYVFKKRGNQKTQQLPMVIWWNTNPHILIILYINKINSSLECDVTKQSWLLQLLGNLFLSPMLITAKFHLQTKPPWVNRFSLSLHFLICKIGLVIVVVTTAIRIWRKMKIKAYKVPSTHGKCKLSCN